MTFERPNIAAMQGYTPGEQPAGDKAIKLNTNENPYPPAPAVAEALAAARSEDLRRYPPPTASEFRQAAATLHELSVDNILPTNGGDELLRLVLTTFVDPHETVVVAEPSYSLYPVLTAIQGCQLKRVPLQEGWNLPANFSQQIQGAKLCILVNPHAPSGHLMDAEVLRKVARSFDGILLIDEAYVDFIDPDKGYDSLPLVRELDNVIILRTLSKGYSLAGLRFGYGIGSPNLIAPMLTKTRDSYNTDLLSQRLATAALQSVDHARLGWDRVRASRKKLTAELEQLGLPCEPSQSNFVLCQVPHNPGARDVYQALKERGILVRWFDLDGLRDRLRISIGSEEENSALIDAIREILSSTS
jgi:histidinol-phosphate aminotransferase